MYNELKYLDELESESIHIIRETQAECQKPGLLFSGGKDSVVLLKLAQKAFAPGVLPMPLIHIDTGHNFPEVIAFRNQVVTDNNLKLIVGSVEDSIKKGTVRLRNIAIDSRNAAQAVTLLETISEHQFDACLGGARRDEEKARAKERIFSFRDVFGQWNPKAQRPELWNLYNSRVNKGENIRVFPLSNWTELDIWNYIKREQLALPSLYFAHQRYVVVRKDLLVPLSELTPLQANEIAQMKSVRFRTVGDISCTCPVASNAATVDDIIEETIHSDLTERGATRMDDQTSESSMEKRKKEGYF